MNRDGLARLEDSVEDVQEIVRAVQSNPAKHLIAPTLDVRTETSVTQHISATLANTKMLREGQMQVHAILKDIREGFLNDRSLRGADVAGFFKEQSDVESLSLAEKNISKSWTDRMEHGGLGTRLTKCKAWCACACHTRQRLRTPAFTNYVFGSVYLGYSGFPLCVPACNDPDCKRSAAISTQLYYRFPSWFISRIVSLLILVRKPDSLYVSLKVPRVVGNDAALFQLAIAGNIDGMKSLFSRGEATPTDVDADSGYSALHVGFLR